MIWALYIGGGIVGGILGLVLLFMLVGACLPKEHHATVGARFAASPEKIWAIVSDFAATPSWNPLVKKVERLPDKDGHEVWREDLTGGPPMVLTTVESVPSRRQVRKIDDTKAMFTGGWTWELTPDGSGTRVTVSEDAAVPFPLFRFMVRLFGTDTYLKKYLVGLAKKLGEPGAKVETLAK